MLKSLFDVKRGKRIIASNRLLGDRPLVTAGYENTGVAGFISNPEQEIFPSETITIDMFANTFYRNYDYSADDNILVLFEKENMNANAKKFISSIIQKNLLNKFSYSEQFRIGSFNKVKIQLPTKNNQLDFNFMQILISAVQKLVIKDVVLYADEKMKAAKQVLML